MKFPQKLKNCAVAALALCGLPVFAAEGDIDTTAASGAITKIQTAISTLFTDSLIPAILVIVGVALAVWLIFVGVRAMKRAGSQR